MNVFVSKKWKKKSHRICEVNKRHKRALLLKLSSAAQIKNTKWKVQSQSSPDTNYVIEKKRKYSSTPTLSRPTVKEINKIKDLESADVKFCGSCLKDDKTTVDIVELIQCDICTVWLHLYCTQPQLTTIPANYICHFCNIKK